MRRRAAQFWRDENGAVAATYAIALIGLVAIAGVGFDYARMVTVDSELQNGADQAALAAATQLDREVGSCARAGNAAMAMLANITLLSNDGSAAGNAITVNNGGAAVDPTAADQCTAFGTAVTFFQADRVTQATTDATARFVQVRVNQRSGNYAFTPIVGAVFPTLDAQAKAGMGSAICRVPPLMICNPAEPAGNTNVDLEFDGTTYAGVGIRLVANDSYTPGAFGFLQTEFGSGANSLLAALGWDVRGGDCVSVDGVEIKNGMNASVMDGLNTRFDVPGTGQSCPSLSVNGTTVNGTCSPSVNSRKDLVRQANSCNWDQNTSNFANRQTANYRPATAAAYPSTVTPEIMGHPRDMCHAVSNAGVCANGRIGTGDWDINAYWRSIYGTNYPAGLIPATADAPQPKGYPTRYQVYRWEADRFVAGTAVGNEIIKSVGSGRSSYAQPQANRCLATGSSPYGLVPGQDYDRRRISVAVLNCTALSAQGNLNNRELKTAGWVDVFLVEPSIRRRNCTQGSGCNDTLTEQTDVYVEVIGNTDIGGDNGSNQQTVRRDMPFIVE